MKQRLVQIVAVVCGLAVASSWLVPSPWPGDEPPLRAVRAARPATPAIAFSGMTLRSGDVDPIAVGSVPAGAGTIAGAVAPATARAVVKAEQTVAISAEINARITEMPYREGERFRAGATLVAFDCRRTQAELAAATAALGLARNAHDTARQLHKLGAAGVFNVRQAQFETDKAAAEVAALEAKQGTCVIRAPFDGVVAEKLAAAHEVVAPNQPLLRIVDTADPELQLIVPSAWIDRLSAGLAFEVEIDENRRRYGARVQSVSGAVDPVSQTVRVLARFEGQPSEVAPGMSGVARFTLPGGER